MAAELTIGKVGRLAGVNIQTVRYYERRGLLLPSNHRDSGYRLYDEEAIKKLLFIKNAQELGFTLKEISGLLRLRVSSKAHCGAVKRKAEVKLESVRSKIVDLEALEKVLLNLIRACRSRTPSGRCPILKSLEFPKRRSS